MLKSQNLPQSLACVHFYSSDSWFTQTKTEDSMQKEDLMWSNEFEEWDEKNAHNNHKCARRVALSSVTLTSFFLSSRVKTYRANYSSYKLHCCPGDNFLKMSAYIFHSICHYLHLCIQALFSYCFIVYIKRFTLFLFINMS